MNRLSDADKSDILQALNEYEQLTPDHIGAFTVEPAIKVSLFKIIAVKVDSSSLNLDQLIETCKALLELTLKQLTRSAGLSNLTF